MIKTYILWVAIRCLAFSVAMASATTVADTTMSAPAMPLSHLEQASRLSALPTATAR